MYITSHEEHNMKQKIVIEIDVDENDEILTVDQQISFFKDKMQEVCFAENLYFDFLD